MNVTISISGDKEAIDRLQRLGRGVINLHAPMQSIATYLSTFFSGEVFASRGRVIGEPWKPLNPHYAVEKAQHFPGRPPLVRTGLMIRSFRGMASANSATITNTAPYFGFHQEGTRRLPARVMMKVDQQRLIHIGEIIGAHVARETA